MADEWRVKVEFEEEEQRHRLTGFLHRHEPEHELAERLRGRVVVSQDGPLMFLYADARDQAEAAMEVVRGFLDDHDLEADVKLARWHEAEERWEAPSAPLPQTASELEAERERLTDEEREESRKAGMAEWEVQVQLPDHGATKRLAGRLESEGLKPLRRWRYLVVPVDSEEDGNELAERVRAEAPPGARVVVQGSEGATAASNPRFSAFSLFGGLGG